MSGCGDAHLDNFERAGGADAFAISCGACAHSPVEGLFEWQQGHCGGGEGGFRSAALVDCAVEVGGLAHFHDVLGGVGYGLPCEAEWSFHNSFGGESHEYGCIDFA